MDDRVPPYRTSWPADTVRGVVERAVERLESRDALPSEAEAILDAVEMSEVLESLCNIRRLSGDEALLEAVDALSPSGRWLVATAAVTELDQLDWIADKPRGLVG